MGVRPRSHFLKQCASHSDGPDAERRAASFGFAMEVSLMADLWTLIADQVSDRVSGPMKFRIVLQPIMATFLAVRSGLRDAKSGRSPYFWSLLTTSGHRAEIIKDGWKSVGRLFLLAMILDLIYQIFVQSSFHLRAALFVAFVLAIVPYLLLRGTVTRIARRFMHRPVIAESAASETSRSRRHTDADPR
jgi:hypothetical protein